MMPQGRLRSPARALCSLLPLLMVCLAGGCRSSELLESELRAREQDVRELRAEVSRLECHNEALQREVAAHQQGSPILPPEVAAQTYTLRRITLGRGTGGRDNDHHPGDEALEVVIEPRDDADHIIKSPGSVTVVALEVSPEGIKTPISSWNIPTEKLRSSWRTSLFGSAYDLVLPWQTPPSCEQVRVVARLQLPDGRLFEVDRDVKIHLMPEAGHRPPPAGLPLPDNVLPVPQKVDPVPGPPLPVPTVGRTSIEQTANWEPLPLDGLLQPGRPMPVASPP
jgi:hypothetical protein